MKAEVKNENELMREEENVDRVLHRYSSFQLARVARLPSLNMIS